MTEGLYRLRVNHVVAGRLRWLSHLEQARAMERLIRRSGLPYASTQGFSPHMKVAFGPALAVGVGGLDEYIDIWLTRRVAVEEATERLRAAAVEELAIKSVAYVPERAASLTAVYVVYHYEVRYASDLLDPTSLQQAFCTLMEKGQMEVERKGKVKTLLFADFLVEEPEVSEDADQTVVRFAVRSTERGTIRPDLFCAAATGGAQPLSIVRTRLSQEQV